MFLFVLGDGADEQPFVTEKMSGYETNLYLYSVKINLLYSNMN